jgi:maltose alpha-D-glucosyltransferase/alpha-amylase
VNRGGVDLLGANPAAPRSAFGLPRATSLYGPLPEQLRDPQSFASQLKRMLAARKRVRLHEGTLMAAPTPKNKALGVLVFALPGGHHAVTVLNFGRTDAAEAVDVKGRSWTDMLTGARVAGGARGHPVFRVPALTGTTFVESP